MYSSTVPPSTIYSGKTNGVELDTRVHDDGVGVVHRPLGILHVGEEIPHDLRVLHPLISREHEGVLRIARLLSEDEDAVTSGAVVHKRLLEQLPRHEAPHERGLMGREEVGDLLLSAVLRTERQGKRGEGEGGGTEGVNGNGGKW